MKDLLNVILILFARTLVLLLSTYGLFKLLEAVFIGG